MKFDFIIGNPPYQKERESTSDKPIYNNFMDAVYPLADKVELITPARFLFNTGKTPKAWNEKMLSDPHFKVIYYEQNSSNIFPSATFTGGIAITYHDITEDFGAIDVFSQFEELRAIREKMQLIAETNSIVTIMFLQNRFNLDAVYSDYPDYKNLISSGGQEKRIVSSSFDKLSIFTDEKCSEDSVRILGVLNGKRQFKWIERKYVEDNGNLKRWKVVVSKSNGSSGTLSNEPARIIAPPMICEPDIGYTQTFIGIGDFHTEQEAKACLKYIKGKFSRALLGILKATQDNPPDRWRYVPIQDFTVSSDIDWSKSIREIDQQLYKKYGLDENEIAFIESHVKEMD